MAIYSDLFPSKPLLLKAVARPASVADSEITKARPVYIDGLGAGGGGATADDIMIDTGGTPASLQEFYVFYATTQVETANTVMDLIARVEALEDAAA